MLKIGRCNGFALYRYQLSQTCLVYYSYSRNVNKICLDPVEQVILSKNF